MTSLLSLQNKTNYSNYCLYENMYIVEIRIGHKRSISFEFFEGQSGSQQHRTSQLSVEPQPRPQVILMKTIIRYDYTNQSIHVLNYLPQYTLDFFLKKNSRVNFFSKKSPSYFKLRNKRHRWVHLLMN